MKRRKIRKRREESTVNRRKRKVEKTGMGKRKGMGMRLLI